MGTALFAASCLHSPRGSRIVRGMSTHAHLGPIRPAAVALMLAAVAACGSRTVADPKNREVAWAYGPTVGAATSEHVRGAGKENGVAPIAQGWQCRLHDGKRKAGDLLLTHFRFDVPIHFVTRRTGIGGRPGTRRRGAQRESARARKQIQPTCEE